MDEEGDSNYREAIRQLETQTDWSELTADLVPMLSNKRRRGGRFHHFAFHSADDAPENGGYQRTGLLLLEIGGLILVGLGLIFMLYVASR
jgi:hypothetical protein